MTLATTALDRAVRRIDARTRATRAPGSEASRDPGRVGRASVGRSTARARANARTRAQRASRAAYARAHDRAIARSRERAGWIIHSRARNGRCGRGGDILGRETGRGRSRAEIHLCDARTRARGGDGGRDLARGDGAHRPSETFVSGGQGERTVHAAVGDSDGARHRAKRRVFSRSGAVVTRRCCGYCRTVRRRSGRLTLHNSRLRRRSSRRGG